MEQLSERDQDILNRVMLSHEVLIELSDAMELHGPMASAHEGWAVLYEEVDELWEEVRKKPSTRSKEDMKKEAIQIAAMAMRFVLDVC